MKLKTPSEVNMYGKDYYHYVIEELKEVNKTLNRHTEWINTVLNNREKHFEIVVRFAEDAKRRLGNKHAE